MYKHRITVFTPTYNRAHIIGNLYRSLQRQSFTDFEWLVIDDGSVDETENLFEKLKLENDPFEIRYVKKENGGKHTATNTALELANGELFFVVDSDDYCTDNALEQIDNKWEKEMLSNSNACCLLGIKTPISVGNEKLSKLMTGERAFCYRTDIVKQYRYPVFKGEKFITEATLDNQMRQAGYEYIKVDESWQIVEYKADGLTFQGISLYQGNPKGYAFWLLQTAKMNHKNKIQMMLLYNNYYHELKGQLTKEQISQNLNISKIHMNAILFIQKCKNIFKR
ncbi:MAG: glycosyltransferase family A protein [Bacillota bacterium]|nr:glycosyltransferase family A protein [Bacillota bacterium]